MKLAAALIMITSSCYHVDCGRVHSQAINRWLPARISCDHSGSHEIAGADVRAGARQARENQDKTRENAAQKRRRRPSELWIQTDSVAPAVHRMIQTSLHQHHPYLISSHCCCEYGKSCDFRRTWREASNLIKFMCFECTAFWWRLRTREHFLTVSFLLELFFSGDY